ncbi:DUF3800 domain-containing protein [Sediminimonas sp.]|uniref:DUF3800 domain-containing protein n=1 Tax=Sediminimonas sp. TaxID=2823379 RepID=UPI0025E22D84|nr:DUF3800 domain-containing protein [Sediminimonas sp.]
MKYTFFIDESGQSGIKKIRGDSGGGASRYMTLGGALVPNSLIADCQSNLEELAKEFSKPTLHCSKLNHNQICRFARRISEMRVLLFGVISMKETLGSYKDDIEGSDKRYYNKCAQYILERLALFLEINRYSENNISICFEEGNFDYAALRGLIHRCRENPIRTNTKLLKHINPDSIVSKSKSDEPLLQVADLVAHALFRCVDDSPATYGIRETRYLAEMQNRFFSDVKSRKILGYGVYPVHKLKDIKADPGVEKFLSTFGAV